MNTDSPIRVAFADDHTLFRKGVIALLQSCEYISVDVEAADGSELIEKLEQAAVLPHICIIDISMPVMDGYAALAEIRRRWPLIKSLILTSYSSDIYVIRLMLLGAAGYLLKKCTTEDITDALLSIHNNGYYYSETANSTLFHLIRTNAIKIQPFTDSELMLLKFCCTDLNYVNIAEQMKVSVGSVHGTRDRLFSKLNVTSRVELALFAVQYGLVAIESNITGKNIIQYQKPNTKL